MKKYMSLLLVFVLSTSFGMWLNTTSIVKAQTATPPSLESEVSLDTGNGFGTTGLYARRFANIDAYIGSDITYTDDAANGAYFTVNTNGLYSITYTDGLPNVDNVAISLNASASTSVYYTAAAKVLCVVSISSSGSSCSVTILLNSGDVIRAHRYLGGASYPGDTEYSSRFIMTKIR